MPFANKFLSVMTLLLATATNANSQLLIDLSKEVLQDLLTMFINGTVQVARTCVGSDNSAPQTQYWMYTRDNTQNPSIITEPNFYLTPSRSKIIFLVHGWTRDANATNIVIIKDAYLTRYNAYVISVNWGAYSHQSYYATFCAVPGVASNVANFMCQLKQKFNISLSDIHAVGHSIGAHLLGIAGRLVAQNCGEKIGRITGLDPAGPVYNGIDEADRLDPSDALFVDVMHTDVGQVGYAGNIGHIDSYANCGYYQPGCSKLVFSRDVLENTTSILHLPLDLITCSHERSCDFFKESITSNVLMARQCIGCGRPTCFPNYISRKRKIIGEDCTKPGKVQSYVFSTRSSPPFGKG